MFGFQETLIVATIVLGILFVPKMMNRPPVRPVPRRIRPEFKISVKMRVALVLSLVYPLLAAAYFQPWQTDPILFYYVGIGPVALGWMLFWVLAGLKKTDLR